MKGILKKKQGISLIVLVITIIVIVILSVSVILTIAKNNPIDSAREAVFKGDLKTMQEEVDLYIASQYATNYGSVNINGMNYSYDKMTGLFPSTEKYKDKVMIQKGKVVLVSSTAQEEKWANEIGITKRQTSVWDGTSTDTSWYSETANTYYIYTAEQFVSFRDLVNAGTNFENKTVKLVNNIELGDVIWESIGTYEKPFSGTFDGDGNAIYAGCIVYNSDGNGMGLFGTAKGATIRNLEISRLTLDTGFESNIPNNYAFYKLGILVGCLENGNLENCYTQWATYHFNDNTSFEGAGIVYECSNSTISNCYSHGNFNKDSNYELSYITFGGIVNNANNSTIKNCYYAGSTDLYGDISTDPYGGIVASGRGSNIENCYNLADANYDGTAYQINARGIGDAKEITNCYNSGNITLYMTGSIHAVRIEGIGSADKISNCLSSGSISFEYSSEDSLNYLTLGSITTDPESATEVDSNTKYKLEPSTSISDVTIVKRGTLDPNLTMPSVYDVVSTNSDSWVDNGSNLPTLKVFNK